MQSSRPIMNMGTILKRQWPEVQYFALGEKCLNKDYTVRPMGTDSNQKCCLLFWAEQIVDKIGQIGQL